MYGKILSIGTRKQLFIDNWIVEDTWCVPRVIHSPARPSNNPVLTGDQQWENALSPEVRRRPDGSWEMWYTAYTLSMANGEPRSEYRIAYAVSDDGMQWRKPNLGLVKYNGSSENNLVIDTNHVNEQGQWIAMNRAHCLGPQGLYLVEGVGPANDDGRLHATTKTGIPELLEEQPKGGICHLVSDDGLRWRRDPRRYIMIYGHSDCMNHIVWSPELKKYHCYMRPPLFAGPAKRRMAVSQSEDMVDWTQPVVVLTQDEADPPCRDFDRCRVFRYQGLWLCFLATYDHLTWKHAMQVELIHSRDGLTWHRMPNHELIFECGPAGSFDEGWAVTTTRPFEVDGSLRAYYDGLGERVDGSGKHEQRQAIGMATWRLDGFVSRRHTPWPGVRYASAPGQILTRPFHCDGGQLYVNARTQPYRNDTALRVEVMEIDTASGDHLRSFPVAPGYACEDCVPWVGDETAALVEWKQGRSLDSFRGKVIRLKFYLHHAEIFAFQIK